MSENDFEFVNELLINTAYEEGITIQKIHNITIKECTLLFSLLPDLQQKAQS
jgi:hypothetical protein